MRLLWMTEGSREFVHYEEKIYDAIGNLTGFKQNIVFLEESLDSPLEAMLRAHKILLDLEEDTVYLFRSPNPAKSIIGVKGVFDVEEFVAVLDLENRIESFEAENGKYIITYIDTGEGLIPLLIKTENTTVTAPVESILTAIIWHQIQNSSEGKTPQLPVWLHPYPVALIPVKDDHLEYALVLATTLNRHGVNVLVLEPTSSIGSRIRWSGKRWIPYVAVIGDREVKTGTVTLRRRSRVGEQEVVDLSSFVDEVTGVLQSYGSLGKTIRVSNF
jgi:hypothetical protein